MPFDAIGAMRWGKSADYLGIYGAGSTNAGVTYVHANPKYINVNRWDYKDNQGQLLIQEYRWQSPHRRRLPRIPGAESGGWSRTAEAHLCRRVW